MDLLLPEFGIVTWIVFIIIGVILPIVAIVSLFQSNKSNTGKIGWLLVILLFPMLGAIVYFVIGRKKN